MSDAELPQFFHQKTAVTEIHSLPATNRAIYVIPGKNGGKDVEVLVECAEGGGNVPRSATGFDQFNRQNLPDEMEAVARVAETVVETLKQLAPGGMEIEFGIELGGEGGIPLLTKYGAKANFKITLKWEGGKKE